MPVVYGIRHKIHLTIHYIGSTKNLYHRFKSHKSYCNNPNAHNYSQAIYEYIRSNGGFDEFECFVIWQIPEHASHLVKVIEEIEIQKNIETVKNKRKAFTGILDDVNINEIIG